MRPLATATVLLALAVPAQAAAAGERQTFTARFTTAVPGAPAGVALGIDYVNPDDPAAKPPAVAEVVIQTPDGTRVDTSVPSRCDAPDPLLMALGEGACPEGSAVGHGELVLHTGAVLSEDAITLLNAADQLIFLTRPKEAPIPGGLVTRSAVQDGAFHTAVPPIPGLPPPDTFTALDRVQLELGPRTSAAGSYITTPPVCPPEGVWTTTATFTYRDGLTQSATATSPCNAAGQAPAGAVAESGCLARRARVGAGRVGPLRIGRARSRSASRYCVRGGGVVRLAFSANGRTRLIASTAAGHRARGVGPGARVSTVRRTFRGARRLGAGLLVTRGSHPVVFGHRRGRVRFVAVAGRREINRPALLRHRLSRAGLS